MNQTTVKSEQGYILIAGIIAVSLVAVLGTSIALMNRHQHKVSTTVTAKDQAKNVAQIGLYRALNELSNHSDWSGLTTNSFAGLTYNISHDPQLKSSTIHSYAISITNPSRDAITVISTGTYKDAHFVVTKKVARRLENAHYLNLHVSDAHSGPPNLKNILGITVENTHTTKNITISQIYAVFETSSSEKITTINVNDNAVWAAGGIGSPSGPQKHGTILDIVDVAVPANTTIPIDIYLDSLILNNRINLFLVTSDGSIKMAEFLITNKQAHYLECRTNTVARTMDSDTVTLAGISATNLSDSTTLTLDKLKVYWDKSLTGSERLKELSSSTPAPFKMASMQAKSGTTYNINDIILGPGVTSVFNLKMAATEFPDTTTFTIEFIMSDGSSKSVDYQYISPQSDFLTWDTSNYWVGTSYNTTTKKSYHALGNILFGNNSSSKDLVVSHLQYDVSNLGANDISSITVAGQVVSSSPSLGTKLDITDFEIPTGNTSLQFSANFDTDLKNSGTHNITLYFQDGSHTNIPGFKIDISAAKTFSLDTTYTAVKPDRNNRSIIDIVLANTANSPVTITGLTILPRTPKSRVNDQDILYHGPDYAVVGNSILSISFDSYNLKVNQDVGYIDIPDYAFPANEKVNMGINFNGDVSGQDLDITIHFSDGSSKQAIKYLSPESFIAGENWESGSTKGGSGFITSNWIITGGMGLQKGSVSFDSIYSLRI